MSRLEKLLSPAGKLYPGLSWGGVITQGIGGSDFETAVRVLGNFVRRQGGGGRG